MINTDVKTGELVNYLSLEYQRELKMILREKFSQETVEKIIEVLKTTNFMVVKKISRI